MRALILIITIFSFLFSCTKENIKDNVSTGYLQFSSDTITFDTIFTSIGSITKTLKVYNRNDFIINTNISLSGSSAANFRINIDGVAGNYQNNVEIPSNDSIFIFLEVTIDPTNNSTPFILADSLIFVNGSIEQNVDLVAWGQDAYFHTADTFGIIISENDTTRFYYHSLDCSIPWENDKPHVIYGYAIINPGDILTINPGCKIYLHKNSGILVGNPFAQSTGGSIKVKGEFGNEVTFQGDRLDPFYNNIPGQWDRIWLTPGSIDNEINYAIIKNGNIGIHADTVYNNNPTIKITNTIIKNMSGIGILGQGAKIIAENTVISKCGQYLLACNIGGNYTFTHCTFANYWNYNSRNTPSVLLNNYYEGVDGNIYVRDLESANFYNCIIDGSLSTELSLQNQESGMFNYLFDHCLIKLENDEETNSFNYINPIVNQIVKFENKFEGNFHLTKDSPAINAGKNTDIISDLEGVLRATATPDLGAYEFVE